MQLQQFHLLEKREQHEHNHQGRAIEAKNLFEPRDFQHYIFYVQRKLWQKHSSWPKNQKTNDPTATTHEISMNLKNDFIIPV